MDDRAEGTLGKAADHTRLIYQQAVMPLRGTSTEWTEGQDKMATDSSQTQLFCDSVLVYFATQYPNSCLL